MIIELICETLLSAIIGFLEILPQTFFNIISELKIFNEISNAFSTTSILSSILGIPTIIISIIGIFVKLLKKFTKEQKTNSFCKK